MKFDLFWLFIIAIFLLGIWNYSNRQKENNDIYTNRKRLGLLFMVISFLLGLSYYFSNLRTFKAHMNGDCPELLNTCINDMNKCIDDINTTRQQANNLWADYERLRHNHEELTRLYQENIGTVPTIGSNVEEDLSTLMQSKMFV